ncbi:MAG TPA: cytochrome P450 [Chloroflexota bacterium]|nr:cytochrome P450 [Chloroflexota bacterium]
MASTLDRVEETGDVRGTLSSPDLPQYDWEQILRHDKSGDFWIVFRGGVYDVSEWMYRHPGGAEILIGAWGQDVTELFESIGHTAEAQLLTHSFRIGVVRAGSTPPPGPPRPTMTVPDGPRRRGPGEHQAGPKLRPLAAPEDAPDDTRRLPEYDWDEILRHDKPGDYWIVMWGGVYDVSEWIYHHPGGAEVYIQTYGHDASQAFNKAGHSDEAWKLAQTFKVGRLKEGSTPPVRVGSPTLTSASLKQHHPAASSAAPEAAEEGPLEIPWAVRWLVPKGERFANFDILNDNDTQLEYYRRFGHIYAVGIPTKKWRLVMVSDPDLLDEIASNEEQYGKRVEDINFFDQLAGSRGGGISIVSDSEYYNRVRRVMLPWYAPAHQKTQFERMRELAKRMIDTWESMPDDAPLDLKDWMERYALEVSGRGACNYDFGLLEENPGPSAFARAVPDSTKESIRRIVEPRPDFTLLSGPSKRRRKRKYRQDGKVLFSTAEAIVQGRLNTCPLGHQTDLLTRLITVPDPESGEHLDPATIRDQILMHLSNGFNGPSIIGAWLGYVLATHPDVEEKLIAEIDSITGGDPEYELQYTDLMALPYMTQVIKETLRIYPPMPVTIRRSLKDGMLGRYRIRKDDIILIGSLAAQRDPRYWGPKADEFDPDQFAMEKVVERPRHAFIPFSVGSRQCMAQEVTFMMLRVILFEMYNRYRMRLAPGGRVVKNTAATTKPVSVPIIRLPREDAEQRRSALAERKSRAVANAAAETGRDRSWDRPSEIPEASPFRHLVIAYGSNFGTSKELAERFADRSRIYGYTSEVINLDDLVNLTERTQPWLLIIMTATYTGNPPGNAIAFKAWLEQTEPGCETWKNCRYLVWGLGNSQWNAFLAFPRYVHRRLEELGATPLASFAFGDVGSPTWEDTHTVWNDRVWPQLIELSGAQPSDAAAARLAAEKAAEEALTATDSNTAMTLSLDGQIVAPTILTNAVGIIASEVRALVCRELQAPESPSRTRHLEVSLPPGFTYTAGDHLGVCPKNDEEVVERLAQHLGAALDGVFSVPRSMKVRAVPKGVPLQVRNVLTCLVDITSMPTVPFVDLLLSKALEPDERQKLEEIKSILMNPDGSDSTLRTAIRAGGYNVLHLLDEFQSCTINIFDFLQVAQPLRPRYYSTSSSPRIHGNTVAHISVGAHITPVPGIQGRVFTGMSSHYVHSLREGDRVNVFLDRAEGFHLQEDVTKPMIFVSAGTGYAPMHAFLWERLAMKRSGIPLGPAVLFNGIRSSKLDYIYREEIEQFVAEGVLDHLHVAMSREVPGKREYVQHRIVEQGALIWTLVQEGAYIYVCGSQTMRDDVRAAFVNTFAEQGQLTAGGAEAYMARMEAENRYRPDIWG